jgi:hypothetical protein
MSALFRTVNVLIRPMIRSINNGIQRQSVIIRAGMQVEGFEER